MTATTPMTGAFAVTFLAELIARISQMVIVALASRLLGPAAFGLVVFGWSVAALSLPVTQIAPETVGVRYISEGRDPGLTWRAVTLYKIGVALVILLCLVPLGPWSPIGILAINAPAFWQCTANAFALLVVGANPIWALRGMQGFGQANIARMIQSISAVGLCLILILLAPDPVMVPIGEAMAGIISAALAYFFLRRHGLRFGGKIFHGLQLVDLRLIGLNAFGASAATALWYAPLLVAWIHLSPDDFGLLGAVWRLTIALYAMGLVVYQVLHPIMVRTYTADQALGRRFAARLLILATIGGLALIAGLQIFAGAIIAILFGESFSAARPLFVWISPILLPALIGSVFGYALLSGGQEGQYARAATITTLLGMIAVFGLLVWWPDAMAFIIMVPIMVLFAVLQAIYAQRAGLFDWHEVAAIISAPGSLLDPSLLRAGHSKD